MDTDNNHSGTKDDGLAEGSRIFIFTLSAAFPSRMITQLVMSLNGRLGRLISVTQTANLF